MKSQFFTTIAILIQMQWSYNESGFATASSQENLDDKDEALN